MGEKGNGREEVLWRRECPRFSGVSTEYKNWKGQVEDWMVICEERVKYPGIEIRMGLKGKALAVAEEIDREVLKGATGPKIILEKLDKVYLKDTLMDNYEKMKKYFKIGRESDEKMRDYIIRYEKAESECRGAMGKPMLEGEAKGFHVLEQANLTENQKQMVLAACGNDKLEYDRVSQIMKRIFEGLGNKEEESEWWGSVNNTRDRGRMNYHDRGRGRWIRGRDGRNPTDREGKITLCVLCSSEWHWARECPQSFQNRKRQQDYNTKKMGYKTYNEKENEEEKIYIGEVGEVDVDSWNEVDAILDTGCKSTVCGEM